MHVGPRSGDVLAVPLGDLDLSADGLISGPLPSLPSYPPCRPAFWGRVGGTPW